MAVYTPVPTEALADFLTRYDVGELVSAKGIAEGVENTNYLVDTTKGRFILTLYERRVDASDLPFFLAMLDHLAARGQPVPPAVRDRAGTAIHTLEGRPACLIAFLPGLSPSHPTAVQAHAAGAALGAMHRALADFAPTRPNTMGVDTWRPLFDRCGHSLDQIATDFHDTLGTAIDNVTHAWQSLDLPHAAIHADLFPDNVLIRGNRVSGLIDFYFACTDIRAYDLAVAHTAWAFAPDDGYDAAIGDALIAGYDDTHGRSPAERDAFALLARGACLRFTLSRAWDWLNTPPDAIVTRKDPLAYWRRYLFYTETR